MAKIFIEIIKLSFYSFIPIAIFIYLSNNDNFKYSSKFKYNLSIIIAIRMLFIFKIKIYLPKQLYTSNNLSSKSININPYSKFINNGFNLFNLLFYIWLIIIVFISIYLLYKYIKFNLALSRARQSINDNLIINVLVNQQNDLKIKQNVDIYKLDGLYTPIITGIFKSKIILPDKKYTESELNFILKHELIHYKRKDNFFKCLMTMVNIIYWFNPIIYILRHFFYEQCELSCDETVIDNYSLFEIKEYSLILLNIIKSNNQIEIPLYISQLKTKKSNKVKRRINNMFLLKNKKRGITLCIVLCTIITSTAFLFQYSNATDKVHAENVDLNEFIKAVGTNNKIGYVKKNDLYNPQPLNTLEEVEAYVKEKEKNPIRMIPLYDESGKNIIGEYRID